MTGFEPGPLVLAFVLGPIMENAFRRSMLIYNGDPGVFFTRPISGAIFAVLALLIIMSVFQFFRRCNENNDLDSQD